MYRALLAIAIMALITAASAYFGSILPGVENYDRLITGDFISSVGSGCG